MKKLVMLVLAMGMASTFVKPAHSVDNASVNVILTIQQVSVFLVIPSTTDAVRIVTSTGTSKTSASGNPAVFKNDGNFFEDFSLRVASSTGASWTLKRATDTLGANEYR